MRPRRRRRHPPGQPQGRTLRTPAPLLCGATAIERNEGGARIDRGTFRNGWGPRTVGSLLLILSVTPLYRLVERAADPYRASSLAEAEARFGFFLASAAVALLLGVLCTVLVPARPARGLLERIGARVESIGRPTWTLATAVLGFASAMLAEQLVHGGRFTNVDEIVSYMHARYLASGEIAARLPIPAESWVLPNSLVVDAGWVSQYPPSHLVLMAVAEFAGAPRLLGPLLFAMYATFAWLTLERVSPDTPASPGSVGCSSW